MEERMKLSETRSKRWRFGVHPVWIQGAFAIAGVIFIGTWPGMIFGTIALGMGIQALMDMTP
jgi:hypothetical protein